MLDKKNSDGLLPSIYFPFSPFLIETLEKTIPEDSQMYAIVDCARNKTIYDYMHIYEPEYRCLYWGILKEKLEAVAPYLVKLQENCEFTQWLLDNGYGDNQFIILYSIYSLDYLTEHFMQYIIVNLPTDKEDQSEEVKKALFSFYDPRVFTSWTPKLTKQAAHSFFYPLDLIICENPKNTKESVFYQISDKKWHINNIDLKDVKKKESN